MDPAVPYSFLSYDLDRKSQTLFMNHLTLGQWELARAALETCFPLAPYAVLDALYQLVCWGNSSALAHFMSTLEVSDSWHYFPTLQPMVSSSMPSRDHLRFLAWRTAVVFSTSLPGSRMLPSIVPAVVHSLWIENAVAALVHLGLRNPSGGEAVDAVSMRAIISKSLAPLQRNIDSALHNASGKAIAHALCDTPTDVLSALVRSVPLLAVQACRAVCDASRAIGTRDARCCCSTVIALLLRTAGSAYAGCLRLAALVDSLEAVLTGASLPDAPDAADADADATTESLPNPSSAFASSRDVGVWSEDVVFVAIRSVSRTAAELQLLRKGADDPSGEPSPSEDLRSHMSQAQEVAKYGRVVCACSLAVATWYLQRAAALASGCASFCGVVAAQNKRAVSLLQDRMRADGAPGMRAASMLGRVLATAYVNVRPTGSSGFFAVVARAVRLSAYRCLFFGSAVSLPTVRTSTGSSADSSTVAGAKSPASDDPQLLRVVTDGLVRALAKADPLRLILFPLPSISKSRSPASSSPALLALASASAAVGAPTAVLLVVRIVRLVALLRRGMLSRDVRIRAMDTLCALTASPLVAPLRTFVLGLMLAPNSNAAAVGTTVEAHTTAPLDESSERRVRFKGFERASEEDPLLSADAALFASDWTEVSLTTAVDSAADVDETVFEGPDESQSKYMLLEDGFLTRVTRIARGCLCASLGVNLPSLHLDVQWDVMTALKERQPGSANSGAVRSSLAKEVNIANARVRLLWAIAHAICDNLHEVPGGRTMQSGILSGSSVRLPSAVSLMASNLGSTSEHAMGRLASASAGGVQSVAETAESVATASVAGIVLPTMMFGPSAALTVADVALNYLEVSVDPQDTIISSMFPVIAVSYILFGTTESTASFASASDKTVDESFDRAELRPWESLIIKLHPSHRKFLNFFSRSLSAAQSRGVVEEALEHVANIVCIREAPSTVSINTNTASTVSILLMIMIHYSLEAARKMSQQNQSADCIRVTTSIGARCLAAAVGAAAANAAHGLSLNRALKWPVSLSSANVISCCLHALSAGMVSLSTVCAVAAILYAPRAGRSSQSGLLSVTPTRSCDDGDVKMLRVLLDVVSMRLSAYGGGDNITFDGDCTDLSEAVGQLLFATASNVKENGAHLAAAVARNVTVHGPQHKSMSFSVAQLADAAVRVTVSDSTMSENGAKSQEVADVTVAKLHSALLHADIVAQHDASSPAASCALMHRRQGVAVLAVNSLVESCKQSAQNTSPPVSDDALNDSPETRGVWRSALKNALTPLLRKLSGFETYSTSSGDGIDSFWSNNSQSSRYLVPFIEYLISFASSYARSSSKLSQDEALEAVLAVLRLTPLEHVTRTVKKAKLPRALELSVVSGVRLGRHLINLISSSLAVASVPPSSSVGKSGSPWIAGHNLSLDHPDQIPPPTAAEVLQELFPSASGIHSSAAPGSISDTIQFLSTSYSPAVGLALSLYAVPLQEASLAQTIATAKLLRAKSHVVARWMALRISALYHYVAVVPFGSSQSSAVTEQRAALKRPGLKRLSQKRPFGASGSVAPSAAAVNEDPWGRVTAFFGKTASLNHSECAQCLACAAAIDSDSLRPSSSTPVTQPVDVLISALSTAPELNKPWLDVTSAAASAVSCVRYQNPLLILALSLDVPDLTFYQALASMARAIARKVPGEKSLPARVNALHCGDLAGQNPSTEMLEQLLLNFTCELASLPAPSSSSMPFGQDNSNSRPSAEALGAATAIVSSAAAVISRFPNPLHVMNLISNDASRYDPALWSPLVVLHAALASLCVLPGGLNVVEDNLSSMMVSHSNGIEGSTALTDHLLGLPIVWPEFQSRAVSLARTFLRATRWNRAMEIPAARETLVMLLPDALPFGLLPWNAVEHVDELAIVLPVINSLIVPHVMGTPKLLVESMHTEALLFVNAYNVDIDMTVRAVAAALCDAVRSLPLSTVYSAVRRIFERTNGIAALAEAASSAIVMAGGNVRRSGDLAWRLLLLDIILDVVFDGSPLESIAATAVIPSDGPKPHNSLEWVALASQSLHILEYVSPELHDILSVEELLLRPGLLLEVLIACGSVDPVSQALRRYPGLLRQDIVPVPSTFNANAASPIPSASPWAEPGTVVTVEHMIAHYVIKSLIGSSTALPLVSESASVAAREQEYTVMSAASAPLVSNDSPSMRSSVNQRLPARDECTADSRHASNFPSHGTASLRTLQSLSLSTNVPAARFSNLMPDISLDFDANIAPHSAPVGASSSDNWPPSDHASCLQLFPSTLLPPGDDSSTFSCAVTRKAAPILDSSRVVAPPSVVASSPRAAVSECSNDQNDLTDLNMSGESISGLHEPDTTGPNKGPCTGFCRVPALGPTIPLTLPDIPSYRGTASIHAGIVSWRRGVELFHAPSPSLFTSMMSLLPLSTAIKAGFDAMHALSHVLSESTSFATMADRVASMHTLNQCLAAIELLVFRGQELSLTQAHNPREECDSSSEDQSYGLEMDCNSDALSQLDACFDRDGEGGVSSPRTSSVAPSEPDSPSNEASKIREERSTQTAMSEFLAGAMTDVLRWKLALQIYDSVVVYGLSLSPHELLDQKMATNAIIALTDRDAIDAAKSAALLVGLRELASSIHISKGLRMMSLGPAYFAAARAYLHPMATTSHAASISQQVIGVLDRGLWPHHAVAIASDATGPLARAAAGQCPYVIEANHVSRQRAVSAAGAAMSYGITVSPSSWSLPFAVPTKSTVIKNLSILDFPAPPPPLPPSSASFAAVQSESRVDSSPEAVFAAGLAEARRLATLEASWYASEFGGASSPDVLRVLLRRGDVTGALRSITADSGRSAKSDDISATPPPLVPELLDRFMDIIYDHCAQYGKTEQLRKAFLAVDPSLLTMRPFLYEICRRLSHTHNSEALLPWQIFMCDFIRASHTAVRLFESSTSWSGMLAHLSKAKELAESAVLMQPYVPLESQSALRTGTNVIANPEGDAPLVYHPVSRVVIPPSSHPKEELQKLVSTIDLQVKVVNIKQLGVLNVTTRGESFINIAPVPKGAELSIFNSRNAVAVCGDIALFDLTLALDIINLLDLPLVSVICSAVHSISREASNADIFKDAVERLLASPSVSAMDDADFDTVLVAAVEEASRDNPSLARSFREMARGTEGMIDCLCVEGRFKDAYFAVLNRVDGPDRREHMLNIFKSAESWTRVPNSQAEFAVKSIPIWLKDHADGQP